MGCAVATGYLYFTEALHVRLLSPAAGVDIPHEFPRDYTAVFGMDVRSCIEHYKQQLGRWACAKL